MNRAGIGYITISFRIGQGRNGLSNLNRGKKKEQSTVLEIRRDPSTMQLFVICFFPG